MYRRTRTFWKVNKSTEYTTVIHLSFDQMSKVTFEPCRKKLASEEFGRLRYDNNFLCIWYKLFVQHVLMLISLIFYLLQRFMVSFLFGWYVMFLILNTIQNRYYFCFQLFIYFFYTAYIWQKVWWWLSIIYNRTKDCTIIKDFRKNIVPRVISLTNFTCNVHKCHQLYCTLNKLFFGHYLKDSKRTFTRLTNIFVVNIKMKKWAFFKCGSHFCCIRRAISFNSFQVCVRWVNKTS